MTLKEFIKKLKLAAGDPEAAEELKKFGIEAETIEEFEGLDVPTTLDEALKIKGVQSEFDKRLAKSADTREAKLKKKFGFGEEEEEEEEEEEIQTKDPAMKALLAKLSKMEKDLEDQKAEKQQQTAAQKKQKAIDYLKSKNIPAVYVHELDLEKDFEEQFEAVSAKVKEDGFSLDKPENFNQRQRLPVPRNPGDKKPSKEEISKIVG
ncbi:hypothetical protein [Leeuwenhoekiella sp. MAR_2009_132]|uniref:hypothetical protein n=1 Tax=Leeuwenhoekiella sp. MAR_2009_132 TaxID=1392489 RepID=UPI000491E072|nr:hypothetical protein [Leeuwenhoekiella sp. MAR_2009_132]